MKGFALCPRCRAEYDDPADRRFQAQPNACALCGPHLELWEGSGKVIVGPAEGVPGSEAAGNRTNVAALQAAAEAIRNGSIVAVKGLGGFHLVVAAHDQAAVKRLRDRKHREEKPLALMFPSLADIQAACEVSAIEERLLRSPESPIVLLRRRTTPTEKSQVNGLGSIAPGNPYLGVMLPYTPVHHLLLGALGFPVVATSGNLSDEPICIDEHEARLRLAGIADFFLVHNRPIRRHVDDSIVRAMGGREMLLRRARGYAPLPVRVPAGLRAAATSTSVLAVGAQLKNAMALSVGPDVFISQHIGDLETAQAFGAFERVIADLQKLYATRPAVIAADAHPDYLSTRFAREEALGPAGPRLISVQHHVAHIFSCMADNDVSAPALGVSWDGTGYGLDGTVWGGEFFLVSAHDCQRFAHLRPFRLPGGDKAVKEPQRTALGLLYEAFGESALGRLDLAPVKSFSKLELASLGIMLARGVNSPLTSSAGRLFDAVAALIGMRQQVRFEGQAAMELEFALEGVQTDEAYDFSLLAAPAVGSSATMPIILDWSSMLSGLLEDIKAGTPSALMSAKFHNGLTETIVAVARRAGQERVLLSGGCFQNRYLTERTIARLKADGFRPYWQQRVPPNDGGIALGQVVAALRDIPSTALFDRQALALGGGQLLELAAAHGLGHAPGRAFQGGLAASPRVWLPERLRRPFAVSWILLA